MKVTQCLFCAFFVASVLLFSHTVSARGQYVGTYDFGHADCSGEMVISNTNTTNVYTVQMDAFMNNPPYNTGQFVGQGVTTGKNMVVEDKKDFPGAMVYVTFEGNKALVTTSNAFKGAGLSGAGVVFDGTWVRK